MIPLYLGFDPREEVGYHAFCSSVIARATEPVCFIPIDLKMLQKVYKGGQKDGTNAFIYSRFLIPYLQEFRGHAIFVDGSDMICKADIAELWAMRNPWVAVQVVPHDYQTKFKRKYIGTGMEADNRDYPKKNWSSVMILNCAHYAWRNLRPTEIEAHSGEHLHQFRFILDRYIDFLPKEWNWLADEYGVNPDAKILHWTTGIPGFPYYSNAPHNGEWKLEHDRVNHAIK